MIYEYTLNSFIDLKPETEHETVEYSKLMRLKHQDQTWITDGGFCIREDFLGIPADVTVMELTTYPDSIRNLLDEGASSLDSDEHHRILEICQYGQLAFYHHWELPEEKRFLVRIWRKYQPFMVCMAKTKGFSNPVYLYADDFDTDPDNPEKVFIGLVLPMEVKNQKKDAIDFEERIEKLTYASRLAAQTVCPDILPAGVNR